MNERRRNYVRLNLARLGLILVLVVIALWAWPATNAHADAPIATSYGGTDYDDASAIQQMADGGYVVAGTTYSFGGAGYDVWVLKLDADGSVAWQKTYGGADSDSAYVIRETANGGYVVTGSTESFGFGTDYYPDAWVLKLDANGGFCEECPLGEDTNVLSADSSATVADSDAMPVNSSATVADSSATVVDTNVIPDPICICIQPDLSVTKIVTPTDEVPYHGPVTYTMVLGNSGLLSDTNVLLTDTLPAEVDFALWVEQPAGAEVVADELTWNGTITVGESITFTFVVSHVGDYSDTVTNTAHFSGTLQAGEDSATFTVVGPEPDLSITKAATLTDNVPYYGTVTYTVVLGNDGPLSDTNVLLTDTLPVEVDFSQWAPGGQPVGAEVIADELTWQGTVIAGESITFTFVVSHVGDYGDTVTNTAHFSGTLQAGEDSATFTVAERVLYTLYLPLVLKNRLLFPPFAITYGGTGNDHAYNIQQTADGGYVVAGYADSFGAGYLDVWVLKLNAGGSVAWQRSYGGTSWEYTHGIQQTADGGYVVVGQTMSFGAGDFDVWVLKLDADGSVTWQKTYGGADGDDAYAIQQTADGGYIVAGYTTSFGAGGPDAWVLKLDTNGNVAWQKTYGGVGSDSVYAIQQMADGEYVVAGYTTSFGTGVASAWVLKLNADGSIAWQKTYGGAYGDYAEAIRQTGDGGYVVAGWTTSFGAGYQDAWVLKLDAEGNIAWQKAYGGIDDDYVNAIQHTGDGGYIVAGRKLSFGAGNWDAWVFKLDAGGDIAWQKTYREMYYDDAKAIQQTRDGGYVVTGSTESFGAGASDAWVLKLDAEGGLCAGCPLGEDSTATPADSSATVVESSATVDDSSATVADSSATVTDTNVTPEPICACPPFIGNRAE